MKNLIRLMKEYKKEVDELPMISAQTTTEDLAAACLIVYKLNHVRDQLFKHEDYTSSIAESLKELLAVV